ncbi:MAG TPA: hypothetical protein VHB02_14710 [Acidimicrobiales bacterium]|nr:hypothetical protein [Acidimicrobiales bacterium]
MKRTRAFSKASRAVAAVAAVAGLTGGAIALTGGAAGATTLTTVSLSIGNNAANAAGTGATGTTNTATYTVTFALPSAAALTSVTFTVETTATTTGAAITPTGLYIPGCSSATATGTGTTVTVTLTGCSSSGIGTTFSIPVSGIINGKAGPFTSTITAKAGATTVGTKTVTKSLETNKTPVTVIVPDTLTFINGNPTGITLVPIPGNSQVTAAGVTLQVKTNAVTGYKLSACMTPAHTLKSGSNGIPALVTPASSLPVTTATSSFGAKAVVNTANGGAQGAYWTSASNYYGYPTSCANPGATMMSNTHTTATDSVVVTNAARAKPTQASGVYNGTITYQVTPHY